MTTLSARVWKANRSFGRALVFWLWLSSFVFGFAASDCFHSATCPEQALLKWAGHASHTGVQGGTFHVVGADIECSACALASVALAIVILSAQVLILLCIALLSRPLPRLNPKFLPALPIARGPPVLAEFDSNQGRGAMSLVLSSRREPGKRADGIRPSAFI